MQKLIEEIRKLKKERNAIILSHNYQLPEVQDMADYRGDSLELSRIAAKSDARVIVFCGVYFMAETASILSPDKTVIMPDKNAGCPMANMITAADLRELKNRHPKAVVVGYVNTSAEVKAELDICCTSTNAVRVVSNLKDAEEIIFVPDKYLADFVSKRSGRRLISWDGYCPTHVKILPEDIIGLKVQASANDKNRYAQDMIDIETLMRLHRGQLNLELVREYFTLFNKQKELEDILIKAGYAR